MNCTRCGRNVPIRSQFCPNCGLANPDYQPRSEDMEQTKTYIPPVQSAPQPEKTTAQRYSQTQQPAPKKEGKKSPWKKLFLLALVVIAVVFVVKKCNAQQLQGTWVADDGSSITFSDSKNGYISVDSIYSDDILEFTYFVDGDEVEIKTEDSLYSYSQTVRYKFKVSGSKLTLTEVDTGVSETFRKK